MSSLGSFTIPGLVINEPEEVETAAAEEVAQQEVATPEPAAEPEPVPPAAEVVPEPAATEPPQPSFEEVLKQRLGMDIGDVESKIKEAEALKQRTVLDSPEVLADQWLKDFLLTYTGGGDVMKYLEVTKTDYGKMTPEEVIMYDIRANSKPGTPQFLIDKKYQQALDELGHLEDMEPDSQEYKNFRQALEWTAGELRNTLAEQGKKFAVPERKPQDPQPGNDAIAIDEAKKYVEGLMKSAPVMGLRASKAIKIGDFSLAVEPDEVVSMVTDNQKLFSHFTNPDGTQNTEKLLKWVALAPNIDKAFESAVADGVAKAKLEWLKELKNPSEPRTEKPSAGSTGISVKWLSR